MLRKCKKYDNVSTKVLLKSIKACPKYIPASAELYVQDKQAHAHVPFKCFVLHRLRLLLCALEIVMATMYSFTNGNSIVNKHVKPLVV